MHVFFHCERFKTERENCLYSWYSGGHECIDLYNLMMCNNDITIKNLSIYISVILKITDRGSGDI